MSTKHLIVGLLLAALFIFAGQVLAWTATVDVVVDCEGWEVFVNPDPAQGAHIDATNGLSGDFSGSIFGSTVVTVTWDGSTETSRFEVFFRQPQGCDGEGNGTEDEDENDGSGWTPGEHGLLCMIPRDQIPDIGNDFSLVQVDWTDASGTTVMAPFAGWHHYNTAGSLVIYGDDNTSNYGYLRYMTGDVSFVLEVNNRNPQLDYHLNWHGCRLNNAG